ncbi:MAG: CoA transferase [Dehalococcoidia bacterium]
MSTGAAGPLAGVRVVEFGAFIAGPFAGQMLADMGADVVKVEPPFGDPWRHHMSFAPGESRVFLSLNRGKRSVCLDLKKPEAINACHRLIAQSDAVISNNRPDTAKLLKIDYPSLSAVNPALVYCEITAYGPKGPEADRPGFDLVMQGYSGVMATEGKMDRGHPGPVRSSSFIDFSTAYAAVNSVLAGLIERGRTGKGQCITTSLLANALAMQTMPLVNVDRAPSAAQRWLAESIPGLRERGASFEEIQQGYQPAAMSPLYRAYYRAYKTLDGAFALGTLAVPARLRLLEMLGLADPRLTDPGYDATTPEAVAAGDRLVEAMEAAFGGMTTAESLRDLGECDIPCEPVQFIEDMVENEQALANGYIVELEHPVGGRYRSSGPVSHFASGNPVPMPSPTLGQHTAAVLEELGYTAEAIAELIDSGCAR